MENQNPEIEKLTSKLNSLFDKNKETVEIYNIVIFAETNYRLRNQKSIFKNYKLNLFLGFFVAILAILLFNTYKKNEALDTKSSKLLVDNSIKSNKTESVKNKEYFTEKSNLINLDSTDNSIKDTNSKDTQVLEIKVKDSVIKSYLLRAEVSKYSIFEINKKIVNLLKSNGIKVIKSESNSIKSKILTEIKQGYSETYNQIIDYNFEYDISYDEPDIQVKLKLINKNKKIKIIKNQLSKLPNSTETKFYNLMKVNIDSLY